MASSPNAPLLVRVDANSTMGMGHAMRCLALAQAWREIAGPVSCLTHGNAERLTARWQAEGAAVRPLSSEPGTPADAAETANLARSIGARWVVVDGYHFGAAYQAALREAGVEVLFVDDEGLSGPYASQVVLNQNPHARPALYTNRAPDTRLLLGLRFAMLRREFRRQAPTTHSRPPSAPHRILVSMGGADPRGITPRVVEALLALAGRWPLQACVVAGELNSRIEELRILVAGNPALELVTSVPDMPALMAQTDLAIVAAGSTCWELARCSVPALVVATAANQRPLATHLAKVGAAVDLGWYEDLTAAHVTAVLEALLAAPTSLAQMSTFAGGLVDGLGAIRVVHVLTFGIFIRLAGMEDLRVIWEWANEPGVRAQSFRTAPIPWEDHVRWFTAQQIDPASLVFVAEQDNGMPVGVVRFRLTDQEAEIGVNLDATQRGRGLGRRVIAAGVDCVFATTTITCVNAYIRPDNEASLRAFEAAGFEPRETTERHGLVARHLVKYRSTKESMFHEPDPSP